MYSFYVYWTLNILKKIYWALNSYQLGIFSTYIGIEQIKKKASIVIKNLLLANWFGFLLFFLVSFLFLINFILVQFFIDHYLYELNHLDDKVELDEEDVAEIERNLNFEVPLRADVRKMLEKLEGFFVKNEPLLC